MSYVYFIRGLKTGLIKVGTSTNPERRVSRMQTGSGERLQIIHKLPGSYEQEAAFHVQFADSRDRGEWFREDGELAKYLRLKKLDRDQLISATLGLSVNVLTRGFCTDERDRDALYKIGIPAQDVWMQGRGAENFAECLESFRGRPGQLVLASDSRILGGTRGSIMKAFGELEAIGVRVKDITHPEDRTMSDLMQRGIRSANKNGFFMNHRKARRRGSMGGIAKAANAAARRQAGISDDIARKLWASRLSKKEKCAILGCTISTGDRHYGVHAT